MQAEKVGYMEAKRDTDIFLAGHARQLQHCPRMHLTALRLPCGEREECVAVSRCPVIAGGEPQLPKPETAPSHGAAVLRKAVVDSGLTLKAFCQQHRICMNTMGQHMRGDMRISPYMLRQYEIKLGIPRKELEDATSLSARGIHRTPRKRCW